MYTYIYIHVYNTMKLHVRIIIYISDHDEHLASACTHTLTLTLTLTHLLLELVPRRRGTGHVRNFFAKVSSTGILNSLKRFITLFGFRDPYQTVSLLTTIIFHTLFHTLLTVSNHLRLWSVPQQLPSSHYIQSQARKLTSWGSLFFLIFASLGISGIHKNGSPRFHDSPFQKNQDDFLRIFNSVASLLLRIGFGQCVEFFPKGQLRRHVV